MTVGPALAAKALDGKAGAPAVGRGDAVQEEILRTLKGILERMPPAEAAATEAVAPVG